MSGHGYGFTTFSEIERRRLVGKGLKMVASTIFIIRLETLDIYLMIFTRWHTFCVTKYGGIHHYPPHQIDRARKGGKGRKVMIFAGFK